MQKIFIFFMLVVAMAVLTGCGKAANPVPYSDYPRTYPAAK